MTELGVVSFSGQVSIDVEEEPIEPLTASEGSGGGRKKTGLELQDSGGGDRGDEGNIPVDEGEFDSRDRAEFFAKLWGETVTDEAVYALDQRWRDPSVQHRIEDLESADLVIVPVWYKDERKMLRQSLQGVPFNSEITGFISDMHTLAMASQDPPEAIIPLHVFGIDLEERKFGPFESHTDSADIEKIEGSLIDHHMNMIRGAVPRPEGFNIRAEFERNLQLREAMRRGAQQPF